MNTFKFLIGVSIIVAILLAIPATVAYWSLGIVFVLTLMLCVAKAVADQKDATKWREQEAEQANNPGLTD